MSDDADKAAQSREGLKDSVTGKAKEIFGAVSGRDDLVEEGQLQQAEAERRKEAVAQEALADAQREEAAGTLQEASTEAARREGEAREQAEREEAAAAQQREREEAAAEASAEQQEAAGHDAAQQRADDVAETRLREAEALEDDADSTEERAAAESDRLAREAEAADQRAAELRAAADAQTEK